MNPFLCLLISFTFITIGDILAKKWVLTSNNYFVIIAVFCYLWSTIFYLPLMKEKGLIISTLAWTLGTLIVGTIIGLMYGEILTTIKMLGLILGIVSIFLLCL